MLQKDREIAALKEQCQEGEHWKKQGEILQRQVDLLKIQHEREKRMVEDKLRELTSALAANQELTR